MKFLSVIMASSLASVTMIFNAILSPIFLKESFSFRLDGVMIIILVSGTIMLCAQQPEDELVRKNMFKSTSFDDVTNYQVKNLFSP
jgi:drug/metabolite transporter (DMT)-like permease